jgi:hypothetical protein
MFDIILCIPDFNARKAVCEQTSLCEEVNWDRMMFVTVGNTFLLN